MDMLARILEWAKAKDAVRYVLMVGSRVHPEKQDGLSDYDLSLFGHDFEFIESDTWLSGISSHLVCIHDQYNWGSLVIPTRLTIFEDYSKVDFSFAPAFLLENMILEQKLAPTYQAGYRVLLDKEGMAGKMPPADFTAYQIERPTQTAFQQAINEFWFESFHVAKYLAREDLWVAKSREHAAMHWLLLMLQWNAAVNSDAPVRAKNEGKNMKEWINPRWFKRLQSCFTGWNSPDQWLALLHTAKLFAAISRETSAIIGYRYDDKPETGILAFIMQLNPHLHGNRSIKSDSNH